VFVIHFVDSGLCDGFVCIIVYDLETSRMRLPWPYLVC